MTEQPDIPGEDQPASADGGDQAAEAALNSSAQAGLPGRAVAARQSPDLGRRRRRARIGIEIDDDRVRIAEVQGNEVIWTQSFGADTAVSQALAAWDASQKRSRSSKRTISWAGSRSYLRRLDKPDSSIRDLEQHISSSLSGQIPLRAGTYVTAATEGGEPAGLSVTAIETTALNELWPRLAEWSAEIVPAEFVLGDDGLFLSLRNSDAVLILRQAGVPVAVRDMGTGGIDELIELLSWGNQDGEARLWAVLSPPETIDAGESGASATSASDPAATGGTDDADDDPFAPATATATHDDPFAPVSDTDPFAPATPSAPSLEGDPFAPSPGTDPFATATAADPFATPSTAQAPAAEERFDMTSASQAASVVEYYLTALVSEIRTTVGYWQSQGLTVPSEVQTYGIGAALPGLHEQLASAGLRSRAAELPQGLAVERLSPVERCEFHGAIATALNPAGLVVKIKNPVAAISAAATRKRLALARRAALVVAAVVAVLWLVVLPYRSATDDLNDARQRRDQLQGTATQMSSVDSYVAQLSQGQEALAALHVAEPRWVGVLRALTATAPPGTALSETSVRTSACPDADTTSRDSSIGPELACITVTMSALIPDGEFTYVGDWMRRLEAAGGVIVWPSPLNSVDADVSVGGLDVSFTLGLPNEPPYRTPRAGSGG